MCRLYGESMEEDGMMATPAQIRNGHRDNWADGARAAWASYCIYSVDIAFNTHTV